MACQIDYKGIPALTDRFTAAHRQAKAAGVPADRAIAVIAVSANESNGYFAMPRPALWFSDAPCRSCRNIVGLEVLPSARSTAERPVRKYRGSILLPENADAVAYLKANGWISILPHPAGSGSEPLVTGTMNAGGGNAIATFFEWCLSQRRMSLMNQFSLGPTQVYLGVHMRDVFDNSLERVYEFYHKEPGEYIRDLRYYGPAYPGVASSEASVISWLRHWQTGSGVANIAEDYYNGKGYFSYKAALRMSDVAYRRI